MGTLLGVHLIVPWEILKFMLVKTTHESQGRCDHESNKSTENSMHQHAPACTSMHQASDDWTEDIPPGKTNSSPLKSRGWKTI